MNKFLNFIRTIAEVAIACLLIFLIYKLDTTMNILITIMKAMATKLGVRF